MGSLSVYVSEHTCITIEQMMLDMIK